MLREKEQQRSFYSSLYERIPEKHILRRIAGAVDFSFANALLEGSYCKKFGRPAKEPELMLKLLFLEYLYNLSDVKVIEEASVNLAFLWFLGLNPEEELPDASLLAKFRRYRLQEFSLDEVITEILRQCVESGLVKGSGVSVDSTHVEAALKRKVPERIMRKLTKRILKGLQKDNGHVDASVCTSIPDYEKIEDPKEARQVMKAFLEETIQTSEPFAGERTRRAIEEAREVLSDEKFLLQKGIRSLADKDARVGRKSHDTSFYGYKMEYAMTTGEQLITAVEVQSGEYVDGTQFGKLLDQTQESGLKVGEVYADKAYFRADILDRIKQEGARAYIPVSHSAYRIDEEKFRYNKDSDQWFCWMGNETVSCKRLTRRRKGKEYPLLQYVFDQAQCAGCAHRAECMGKQQTKARRLEVSLNTAQLYEASQRQKSEEFLTKYKKRAAQESKNAEMKRFHGLARARGYGLRSVTQQAKLTAIAVNLKRIAALAKEKGPGAGVKAAAFSALGSLAAAVQDVWLLACHRRLDAY